MRTAVHWHDNIRHPEMGNGGVNEILEAFDISRCLNNERHGITPQTYQQNLVIKPGLALWASSNLTINLILSPVFW